MDQVTWTLKRPPFRQSDVALAAQEAILTGTWRNAAPTASFKEQPLAQTFENGTGPRPCVAELPTAKSPEGEETDHCAPG